MDRPVDPAFKRRQLVKRVSFSLLGCALLVWLFVWLPGWIRPSLKRDRIRTARVEWGEVEASITASGTVVPEFERVIISPVSTRMVAVLERPGTLLKKGQPIVELDLSESRLAVEKLTEQLALKRNRQTQLGQDLETRLNDLETRRQIKQMEVKSLREKVEQNRRLLELGAVAKGRMQEVELDVAKAGLELKKLEKDMAHIREATQTQVEGLELEMKILGKEREEAQRRLERGHIRASRDGVLTWVLADEGTAVHQGEVVARTADLRSFRVDATVSDIHAGRLSQGMPVRLRVNEEDYLRGSISRILPTIENGIVNLEVVLEDKSSPLLRSNLRVDVYIVTTRRVRTLRIEKGPFINGGEGMHDVFVIRAGVALRTKVRIGLSSFAYYEVVEGLLEGDEVVISDMRDYLHMEEVRVK